MMAFAMGALEPPSQDCPSDFDFLWRQPRPYFDGVYARHFVFINVDVEHGYCDDDRADCHVDNYEIGRKSGQKKHGQIFHRSVARHCLFGIHRRGCNFGRYTTKFIVRTDCPYYISRNARNFVCQLVYLCIPGYCLVVCLYLVTALSHVQAKRKLEGTEDCGIKREYELRANPNQKKKLCSFFSSSLHCSGYSGWGLISSGLLYRDGLSFSTHPVT